MKNRVIHSLLVAFLGWGFCLSSVGEEKSGSKEEEKKQKPELEEEKTSVTTHRGSFGGTEISFRATAGTLNLQDEEVKAKASVFYVAYEKIDDSGKTDPSRPIAFCFNGGPGSCAVWLHLGGLGPQRVALTEDGKLPSPPFRLKANSASILDVADLVFIDPVSTGYSRAAEDDKAKLFHGFEGDLKSVGEVVRLLVHRNGRWLSPKYLIGESYGALRVCGLSDLLQDRYGMYLNGVVLVSGVVDFKTLWGDDLAFVLFLPGLAEVAAYHGKLDAGLIADMPAFRQEVEDFAVGEYASVLLLGNRVSKERRDAVLDKLSRYTSLDRGLIDRANLRIDPGLFRRKLLEDEGKAIGRFDARIIGPERSQSGDPSYDVVYGPFASTVKHYLSRVLEFESDEIYEILTSKVRPWDYEKFTGESVKATPHLAEAMAQNPFLRVLVTGGWQDLATPPFAIRHSLDQLEIDPALFENIEYTNYEGGHMMYTIEASNTVWNEDVRKFIRETEGSRE